MKFNNIDYRCQYYSTLFFVIVAAADKNWGLSPGKLSSRKIKLHLKSEWNAFYVFLLTAGSWKGQAPVF
jgi:hypothetical protein